ncbi:DNA-binding transcriptional response regulator, NtrC family, contains REC, AAA-type ATPase, and a Fis-type DNA-binding domains [Desulfonatronum thiosulfatophilum]|uniref:DNA-binding transcriptional response regulator, NtrC family, contains REC, AAA-type ATPase, and a Fis-type DNA-binding domains n=1 Tax=Desulfonatronum thiosulfatophilum TaxID=617002 RepID=A0A1G6A3L7_9BACT|nr:sigma-54 dependent transcriptional regulator [Desulfonatronum thiosulfatophilum]SDB03009.1 DNA-binding transcriptional response regulator, NtrC family, contains REC, AAA-type ATPase, and a Fis-type DNA-binding domains [Desulfonatronum thiosulfatophilum]
MEKIDHPEIDRLLETMERVCHELAWGRYDRVEELFDLTGNPDFPRRIANLAESFGMMLIKVEAREYRMEGMLADLRRSSDELELARRQLLKENENLKNGLMDRFSSRRIIGQSPCMQAVLQQVARIADTSVNVLISGETGTGKELIAKALHYNSLRKSKPFIAVNCSAVPESLFESELFGIEKGVATGVQMRQGLMELAQGGTLLLDEIGDMPLTSQAKILRVLEERELTRVGGVRPIPLDVRIVAATNKDLQNEMHADRFRQDLYFRLNVVSLALPPLRNRPEDIPLLLQRFLEIHCGKMNRPMLRIDKNALNALMNFEWPGNVRELENEVERLVALSYDKNIRLEDLSSRISSGKIMEIPASAMGEQSPDSGPAAEPDTVEASADREKLRKVIPAVTLADSEKKLIENALKAARGNKSQAARLLGISREGLRKKLKRLYGSEGEL